MPNGAEFEGRIVHVGTFPIGIDPEKFSLGLQLKSIQARVQRLRQKFAGIKVLVGVDRLDYIKGVPQKLHAFELFLSKHPEWTEKVVLVQVAVPSRENVEEYQHLQQIVNELVGRINGRFGTVEFTPIHFIHKSVNFEELVALYAVADACIVSSTRDGMNLVSYEYIVSQQNNHGVLILSEFAGAAQSLNGSIIVNPWNTDELAQGIFDAVTMPEEVRKANHQKLYRYVTKYTAAFWGMSFVKELRRVQEEYDPRKLPKLSRELTLKKFAESSKKKIFFLDYDGTLTELHKMPEFAKPTQSVLNTLSRLSAMPNVYVYVLSGRSREHLDRWFGETGVGLSAEHGCFYRHPSKLSLRAADANDGGVLASDSLEPIGMEVKYSATSGVSSVGGGVTASSTSASGDENVNNSSDSSTTSTQQQQHQGRTSNNGWYAMVDQVDSSWRNTIRPLFQHYTDRTPGSFIEEKEINLTWHYRNSDPEFGSWQTTELQMNLEKILSHMAVSIILGNKTLELRPSMVDKATAARAILKDLDAANDCDFLLCMGDGKTDEVLFGLLDDMEFALTATVGKKQTDAKFYVESVKEAEQLIHDVTEAQVKN